jgi:SAM-dependent methyltransferase
MDQDRNRWNEHYTKVMRGERSQEDDLWLEPWLELVPMGNPRRALDIGCGIGHNAKLLSDRGFEVTAIDFSEVALDLCKRLAPKAHVQWADVRDGLSFDANRFQLIVGDLSLHYFPWDTTTGIIGNLEKCLVNDGLFAGRFNSTQDTNYGAAEGQPVPGETNLFMIGDILKRFFTQDCLDKLFVTPWGLISMKEKATGRYGSRKVLWELVAKKGL